MYWCKAVQDRYFGDIGDFAKLGLLRGIVANDPALCLCVLWYLVPDESLTNDGRHITYLEPSCKNRKRFRWVPFFDRQVILHPSSTKDLSRSKASPHCLDTVSR